jgi:hypothetical protein
MPGTLEPLPDNSSLGSVRIRAVPFEMAVNEVGAGHVSHA